MIKQILLALGLASITVMIHAIGSVYVVLPLAGIWKQSVSTAGRAAIVLTRLVSGLLLLHLVEMCAWALAFTLFDMLPDFETSLYFSLKSYTTVGYGDVLLPKPWRLIGPFEAAVGILMLGWSTGYVVAAVQQVYANRRDTTTDRNTHRQI
jgi:voltage-gated potassium channel